jgi:hypothetical protein
MKYTRWLHLMEDSRAKLIREEKDEGYHFCWDFDGLLVGPEMAEWMICNCATRLRWERNKLKKGE